MVGASAGGVEAVVQLVSQLPPELDAALCVVLHILPGAPSHLPEILSRAGKLTAKHPHPAAQLERGVIYVAPPDTHLRIEGDRVATSTAPPERGHRPSVDTLFRSAAESWGHRTIGIVLSGNLSDGTDGLRAIQSHGGISIVQLPGDARYDGMPRNAIEHLKIDYVLPVSEMPPLIMRLIKANESTDGADRNHIHVNSTNPTRR